MSNIGPKEKVSKQRRNTRHAANYKLSMPSMVECPKCHEMKLAHTACKKCGYYGEEKVMSVKSDKKEK